jgi:hypothetical protein
MSSPAGRDASGRTRVMKMTADGPKYVWGEETTGEADVDLHIEAKHGSYLYPPILHNAAEAIAFWENVEIPDEVCDKVASQYVAQWRAVTEYLPGQMWDYGFRAQREAAGEDVSEEARNRFVDEWSDKFAARPEVMDPRDVRVAAKVIGMIATKQTLPDEERRYIDNYEVETTNGLTTVRDYNLDQGLAYFGTAVTDPSTYRKDIDGELARLRVLLEEVKGEVGESREATDGVVRHVGEQLVDMIALSAQGRR